MTWLSLLVAALAIGQPVALAKVRPVRPGMDAFPRIAAPTDDAQRRINRALARLDAKALASARDCLSGGDVRRGDWARRIEPTMRGPEFVSYLTTDDVDCGGAHPNEGHSAIVYDLRSGAPVDWTTLLPASLTGTLALTGGEDGVQVVTLSSPRLFALYRAGYARAPYDGSDAEECPGTIAALGEQSPPAMLAWLDAKAGGLVLQFDLNHAIQLCSMPVTIPLTTLRREGASERLLAALGAAHVARSQR